MFYNMDILPKKEVKKVLRQLNKQFGFKDELDYIFVKSKKGRIFIVNKEFSEVDFENVNTVGLYVIKYEKDGLRLSIDGSQIIGPKDTKNVLVLDYCEDWLKGKDLVVDTKLKGYVILKFKDDFIGCGKIVKRRLINYIPKTRRILEVAPS